MLSRLAMISIEHNYSSSFDYDEVMNKFDHAKSQKNTM